MTAHPLRCRWFSRRRTRHLLCSLEAVALVALLCVSELALGTGTGAVVPAPAAMNPTLPAGPRIAPPIAAAVPSPTMPLSRPSGPSASLCLLLPVRGCAASPWGSLESPIPAGAGPHSWIDLTPTPIPPAYPDARAFPSEAWDGGTNSVLLFGGLGISQGNFTLEQDTWSFSAGNWTELIAAGACFPTTCPSPRSDAMMTYDAADNEMVLFGGENFTGPTTVAFGDTWVFAGGTWTNITASAGAAPSPRFDAAMTFDSADGYVLLFGGASANGTALGDTWSFQGGTWTNRSTDYSVAPDWRSAASIADDPGGGVLMFGGEANGTILEDNCYAGGPWDAWWYINGTWSAAYKNFTCINSPFGVFSVDSNQAPPCGRIYAGLAWSPKNHRFVLFGGLGPSPTNGTLCGYGASPVVQNDTWLYIGPTGGQESAWVEDNTPGAPSARDAFGAAPDFADGYVLVFGGVAGFLALTNETWRYYAVVQATLGGPLNLTAGAANPPPFLLKGFGGSGDLGYAFNISLLKTTHPLTGPGCAHFSSSAGATVPPTAVVTLDCIPDTTAYNIFAVHVQVWDLQAPTHRAFANWTFTVNPVEKLLLYSQFSGIFYPGFSLTNALGIYAFIAGSAVTKVSASIQGQPVGFAPSGSSPYWWNASVGMGTYGPGAALQVTVSISDWSESATLPFHYAYMPDWLVELASLGGAVQGTTITTSPVQTWNNSYLLSQSVQLPLAKLAKFFLNTVPLVGGNYTLLPTLSMTFSESSSGTVSVGGAVQVNSPSIGIGPFNMSLSAGISLTGKIAVTPGTTGDTIKWVSASLVITITGTFAASIPIYGFDINILGDDIHIGFTLDITIAPSIALTLLMAPATNSSQEFLSGIDLMVTKLIGTLTLPITAAVSFGIGIASVALGGTLALALAFELSPNPFQVGGIWLNGTFFAKATFLFWSATWNIAGPATLYSSTSGSLPKTPATGAWRPAYDNGSDAVWALDNRSYNATGFDDLVWTPAETAGEAVTDLYPEAAPSAASTFGGAYLFYSDDRVDRPVRQGLTISGLELNASTNALGTIPAPSDPGFVLARPQATTMPDGSLFVAWDALPAAEASGTSPADVHVVELHGARYYPGNRSWTPVRVFTTTGIAQSFALDGSGSSPRLAALISPSLLPGTGADDSLETFDLDRGTLLTNITEASASGLSEITGFRAQSEAVAVQTLSGTPLLLGPGPGGVFPLDQVTPAGSHLVGAGFATGSPDLAVLHFRASQNGTVVLYNLTTSTVLARLPVAGDVTDVEALRSGPTVYVYAANASGVLAWTVSSTGVATPLPLVREAGVTSFGLAQIGQSVLLYAVVPDPSGTSGWKALYLAELQAPLSPLLQSAPVPGAARTPSEGSTASFNAALYLLPPILVAAVVLVIIGRRRPPEASRVAPPPPPGATSPPASGPPPGG